MLTIKRHFTAILFFFSLLSAAFTFVLPAAAAETNLVPNPSVETVSAQDSTLPESWTKEASGTNVTSFSYPATGHTGTRSLRVDITSYTNGDSHYKYTPHPVTAGQAYAFSFYYKSDVTTEVDVEIHLASGETAYQYVGDVAPASDWTKYSATVTMPAGAVSATAYATIFSKGYLITDDYSFALPEGLPEPPPAQGNIVLNPSVETVSPANTALPANWSKQKYGRNTTSFSYLTTGHTGSRSVKVNTTKYTNGDAYYKAEARPVQPGVAYDFSVYYKSNTYAEVDAEITLKNGEVRYVYVGSMVPSTTWNQFTATVDMPADAATATVYAALASVGYLTTDDYSLAQSPPAKPFNRAIVTLTYDELAGTVYQYGYPLFQKYAMGGDINIVTQELGTPGMMSKAQLDAFRALGFEIGSHTVTHPYMTKITSAQADSELKNSQTALGTYFGGLAVTHFASPYGEYNLSVIEQIKKYYRSHRTTDTGFNSKDSLDPYRIKAFSIEANMSADYVKGLIDRAAADRTWLVLVYHDIRPDDGSGFLWTTTPENMETVLAYLKEKNVAVMSTSRALDELQGQM